ncbi:immunity protein YezG family protein [Mycobacteroides abscessus]|uniref:immunity protein YezG family protein n=1 Tax=Mycobacteroides abscessus TaxID=36809 RepID=UPI0002FE4392|nr:immunity protein YezG family protein [Mycobacteroides abscessus]
MTDQPPYLVQLGDAQTKVVKPLFDALPPAGWRVATVEYRKAGSVAESKVAVTTDDGQTDIVKSPIDMIRAFKDLREIMASQGNGAWLSVTLTAQPDGKCSFDYNYTELPNWTVQPTDETYIEDLAKYPRPADQIPDWYPRAI